MSRTRMPIYTEEQITKAVDMLKGTRLPQTAVGEATGVDKNLISWIVNEAVPALEEGPDEAGDWKAVRSICWNPKKKKNGRATRTSYSKYLPKIAKALAIELPEKYEFKPGEEQELPLTFEEPKKESKNAKLAQAFRLIAEWLEEKDG